MAEDREPLDAAKHADEDAEALAQERDGLSSITRDPTAESTPVTEEEGDADEEEDGDEDDSPEATEV